MVEAADAQLGCDALGGADSLHLRGRKTGNDKIAYSLQLGYKAPAKGAAIAGMAVTGANFQPQEAGGILLFDTVRGRVVFAEERFRVKGVLAANLLGQNTVVEIDEDQHFLVRIHDKIPQ